MIGLATTTTTTMMQVLGLSMGCRRRVVGLQLELSKTAGAFY